MLRRSASWRRNFASILTCSSEICSCCCCAIYFDSYFCCDASLAWATSMLLPLPQSVSLQLLSSSRVFCFLR